MTPLQKSEDVCAVLVMYDNWLEAFRALPVRNKGLVKYVVDWSMDTLDEAGYRGERITLKSENEPAIVSLKKAVAAARKGDTPLIETPVRESKANGAVEGRFAFSSVRCARSNINWNIGRACTATASD